MKVYYPKNTLAAAMKAAEPQMAQTALGRAESGLATIRDQCLEQLDEMLASLSALAVAAPDVRERLKQGYQLSRRIIGLGHVAGFPKIDAAALGLCDVADGLIARNIADWAPVEAHIGAMRLMRRPDLPEQAAEVLLSGLDALRVRFACGATQATA